MSCGVILDPVSACSFSSIVLTTSRTTQARALRSDGCFPHSRQNTAHSLRTSFVSCVISAGRSSMRRSLCLWHPVKCKARVFGDLACRVPFPTIHCSSNRESGREPKQNLEPCDTRQSGKGHASERAGHEAIELDHPNTMQERQGMEVLRAA